ncbi:hypothetical protein DW830_12050, partial [Prevotella sp. AM34-19LB]|uniref:hypothetical protein n=1 Tax=Prevotella sp. AM34-19LB TaxID=2292364 RepID=UPI000FF6BE31
FPPVSPINPVKCPVHMTADRLDGLQRSIHLPQPYVFVFSIKSVDDIYDFLSILVLLAAVDEV